MKLERLKVATAAMSCFVMFAGAACSNDANPNTGAPEASPSPTPAEPDPVCPLTGLDIPGSVEVDRPAVAVKIENSPQARPQSGLDTADIVFEEVVEGGITRFMAIYHCGDSEKVGPVRSARFDDPKIAKPFTDVIAFSGSNDIVEKELDKQKIISIDEDTPGAPLFRDPPGVLEVHNLFGDTLKIRDIAEGEKASPPTPLLDFGDEPVGGKPAKKVTLNFTSSIAIEYKWKGGAWKRFEEGAPFMVDSGEQISVPNVLVQEVRVDNSTSIFDVAGNPSPDIELEGKGRAFLFRDGQVIKGAWETGKDGIPSFKTKDGDEFVFAPGQIWIELVPSKKGSVKGAFSYK
ncbi:MAG TPA: DUF3048 domain-containing protein [Actinomycetota bacterium]|nr:DUF3048 domain-containing protein [Actinomycetota bacterium]